MGADRDDDIRYTDLERLALITATNVEGEEIFTFDEQAARQYLTTRQYDPTNGTAKAAAIYGYCTPTSPEE